MHAESVFMATMSELLLLIPVWRTVHVVHQVLHPFCQATPGISRYSHCAYSLYRYQCQSVVHAGTTVHRRAPQSELTPLKPGGQAAGRTSPSPKGMAAVKSVIERVVNKADSGRGVSSAGSRHAEEQV